MCVGPYSVESGHADIREVHGAVDLRIFLLFSKLDKEITVNVSVRFF